MLWNFGLLIWQQVLLWVAFLMLPYTAQARYAPRYSPTGIHTRARTSTCHLNRPLSARQLEAHTGLLSYERSQKLWAKNMKDGRDEANAFATGIADSVFRPMEDGIVKSQAPRHAPDAR